MRQGAANFRQDSRALAGGRVFDGVVQERRDRLVLTAAVLEHQGAHAHQVRHVRNSGAFTELLTVVPGRVRQGFVEAFGQRSGTHVLAPFEGQAGCRHAFLSGWLHTICTDRV